MPSLLAYRNHDGLGDWLFAVSMLKMVNNQYPEIDIDLSLHLSHSGRNTLIEDVATGFGVKYNKVISFIWAHIPADYDYSTGHMIYAADSKPYIESMVDVFNERTGLALEYDESALPTCQIESIELPVPDDYILMIGHGKRALAAKDWGYSNFNSLCTELTGMGHGVVQIGMEGDTRLNDAVYHYNGLNLGEIMYLLMNCRKLISISNGLMVLAGLHDIDQLTIYCGNEPMGRSNWHRQMKLHEPSVNEAVVDAR